MYNLSTSPLFRGFTKEQGMLFLERTAAEEKVFERGELIARQGDIVSSLYLLVAGVVRTEMVTMEGNLLEIEMIEALVPLAPAFLFAKENKFPVDVVAMERCTLFLIPQATWLHELMTSELLLRNFLMLNANVTVFLSQKLQMASIKSLKAKIAIYVLENTTIENTVFTLRRSRTQLAEYFGVQRPSLVRTLGEMERVKAIALHGRNIRVLDRHLLEQMI